MVLDALGALFFSAKQPGQGPQPEQGVLVKRAPDRTLTTFATPLDDPTGLVFDSYGNLYAAEQGTGRLLRFWAPPPPTFNPPPPAFTNQNPLALFGTAEAEALIMLLGGAESAIVTADAEGYFTAQIELKSNAANTLQAFAIGAGGQGLVSPLTEAMVVHDDVPPDTSIIGEVIVGDTATFTFTGTDNLTLVGGLTFASRLDGGPFSAFSGSTSIQLTGLAEGSHTFEAKARDLAGNEDPTPAARTFIIDTTPPTITITSPADGATVSGIITISATATDPSGITSLTFLNLTGLIDTDPASDRFSASFNTRTVPDGPLPLTASAIDGAGNTGTASRTVTVANVLVNHPPVMTPLGDQTVDLGSTLSFTISASDPDGDPLTFSVTPVPLPTNATFNTTTGVFTFTPDATQVGTFTLTFTVSDGSLTDSEAITIIVQMPPPTSPQAGFVHGRVFDAATNLPLPGVGVKALGAPGVVFTGSDGRFRLPTPGGGTFAIYVAKAGYVDAKVFTQVEATREATVGTLYLVPFDPTVTTIGPAGGTHRDATGTVEVVFPPGAVAQAIPVTATVFTKSETFPVPIPPGQAFLGGVQFTPEGIGFSQPVTVRFRNRFNLPPGTPVPFAFANHSETDPETVFYDPGMGRVSADGVFLEFAITHFTCIGLALPILPHPAARPPQVTQDPNQPIIEGPQKCCLPGSRIGAKDGSLALDVSLPAVRALGRSQALTLTYHSASAHPRPLVMAETLNDPATTLIPETMTWRLRVGALEEVRTFQGQAGAARFAWSWDARDGTGQPLPTGAYAVEVQIANNYLFSATPVPGLGGQGR